MGDFDDEPFDNSLIIHANSVRQADRVLNFCSSSLWNMTCPVMGAEYESAPDGTFCYNNEPNLLDQFLVNKNMINSARTIRVRPQSVQILRFRDTSASGEYPKPIPFSGMGKPLTSKFRPPALGRCDAVRISIWI
jgi:hypothetical protein